MCPLAPARSRRASRDGRSSPLRAAGALEMADRSRLGAAGALQIGWPRPSLSRSRQVLRNRLFEFARCSKWTIEPARLRWADRKECSGLLGFAGAFKLAGRARQVSLGSSINCQRVLRQRSPTSSNGCFFSYLALSAANDEHLLPCSKSNCQQLLLINEIRKFNKYLQPNSQNINIRFLK